MQIFAAFLVISAAAAQHATCTHGKLYVSDNETTSVHIFDALTLAPEGVVQVNGKAGIVLDYTASGKEVAAIYRGDIDAGFTDGAVTFIDTGVIAENHGDHFDVEFSSPKVVENAGFECARAIHFVRHDTKIAIFCDGSYDFDPQVNSTVWVLDETKFGSQESAIVFQTTLQGSHHGVAIPVDDDHVLYSLAAQERVDRTSDGGSYALPATFQVVDYEGNVLHSIADESSPDTSCAGFHGSWAVDNKFALACDDTHGGILMVNYDPSSSSYTSRALMYPDGDVFADHRTGNFAEHHDAQHIIGTFAGGDSEHLMAFEHSDSELKADNVLTLDSQQCSYGYEHGLGEELLVFMPTGMLHVFKYGKDNGWTELAKVQVVDGMLDCSEAVFTPGVKQAFVLHTATKTLYAVDVEHLVHDSGTKDEVVSSASIDFFPLSAVVGGVPLEAACVSSAHGGDDHDQDHEEEHTDGQHTDEESNKSASNATSAHFLWKSAAAFTLASFVGFW